MPKKVLTEFLPQNRVAFSISEAAAASGLGRNSIYDAIADGSLQARKRGRRTLILATDLVAWLESLETFTATDRAAGSPCLQHARGSSLSSCAREGAA